MKAAIYCRVSTDEQTTDNQLPDIYAFAKSRGYEIADVYSENESGWKNGHQKELARLLQNLETGKKHYDAVIVWALDRLTREGVGTLINYYNLLNNRYNCKLLSTREFFTEYPNEFTPIFLSMLGWMANYESVRRSDRTKAGIARARLQGGGKRGHDKRKRHRRTKLELAAARI